MRHGHVRVNDRKIDIPSYQVKVGDVITLGAARDEERARPGLGGGGQGPGRPAVAGARLRRPRSAKVLALPARDDVSFPIQEQLIVELYSK